VADRTGNTRAANETVNTCLPRRARYTGGTIATGSTRLTAKRITTRATLATLSGLTTRAAGRPRGATIATGAAIAAQTTATTSR
jgi:hypothetical protein